MIVKILQWNIWYKENPKKIASEIKRINPDIICMQELFQNFNNEIDAVETIHNISGLNYFYKESATWNNRPDITSQGNAIFSKFKIHDSKFVYVTPFVHNPENAKEEGRVYLESKFDINGKKLTVGTVHMSYSHKFINSKNRILESDKLNEAIKSKSKNFILTGDFNSKPNSLVIKNILENKNLVNAGPAYGENTWTTKPFNYHGFKTSSLKWRIDYVFTTKDLKVRSSEILESEFSDHLPILITIDFS